MSPLLLILYLASHYHVTYYSIINSNLPPLHYLIYIITLSPHIPSNMLSSLLSYTPSHSLYTRIIPLLYSYPSSNNNLLNTIFSSAYSIYESPNSSCLPLITSAPYTSYLYSLVTLLSVNLYITLSHRTCNLYGCLYTYITLNYSSPTHLILYFPSLTIYTTFYYLLYIYIHYSITIYNPKNGIYYL